MDIYVLTVCVRLYPWWRRRSLEARPLSVQLRGHGTFLKFSFGFPAVRRRAWPLSAAHTPEEQPQTLKLGPTETHKKMSGTRRIRLSCAYIGWNISCRLFLSGFVKPANHHFLVMVRFPIFWWSPWICWLFLCTLCVRWANRCVVSVLLLLL